MDEEARKRVQAEVRQRFPDGAIKEVLVLEHADDPAVEPGRISTRVVISSETPDGPARGLEAFHHAHQAAIKQLGRDLSKLSAEAGRLEFTDGENSLFFVGLDVPGERPSDLTPVMARLGSEDLETLDTLIGAGICSNRAEGVRWALARIRERPAYAKLRERNREIEELKGQF